MSTIKMSKSELQGWEGVTCGLFASPPSLEESPIASSTVSSGNGLGRWDMGAGMSPQDLPAGSRCVRGFACVTADKIARIVCV